MKRTVSLFMAFVLVFALCVFASPQKARAIETGTLVYDPASTGEKFYYEGTTTEVAGKGTLWRISDDGSVLTLMDGFTYETSSDCALYVISPGGSLMIEGSVTLGATYADNLDQVIFITNQNGEEFCIDGSSDGAAPSLALTNADPDAEGSEKPYGIYLQDELNDAVISISDLELLIGSADDYIADGVYVFSLETSGIKLDNVDLTAYTYYCPVICGTYVDIKDSKLHATAAPDSMSYQCSIWANESVTIDNSEMTTVSGDGCIASSGGKIDIRNNSIVNATGCTQFGILTDYTYTYMADPTDGDSEITITNSTVDLKDFESSDAISDTVGIVALSNKNARITIKNSTVNVLGSRLEYGIAAELMPVNEVLYDSEVSIIDSIVNAQGSEAAIGMLDATVIMPPLPPGVEPPDETDPVTGEVTYPGTKTVNITGESTVDANGGAYGIYATDDINIALTGKGSVKATVPEVDHVGQAAIYASSASTITLAEDNIIVVPEGGGIIAVNDVELYGENGAEFVGVKAHPEYGPALDVEIVVKELAPKTGMDDNALLILIPVMAFALAAVFIVRASSKKNAA